jgi:hypothetical protein
MILELPVVSVHSVAEAYLYLMSLRCPVCGKGPVRERGQITKGKPEGDEWSLAAACAACQEPCVAQFRIQPTPTRAQARSSEINPTPHRSEAIDLLGWLTLFQTILAASEKEPDRPSARQLACEAALCLDEALKFYESDDELPRPDAFFTEESRRRFREHPHHFARSKWRQRRLMLPDAAARTRAADSPRWWQFWRRRRETTQP